ncbi:response regulator transcription factor [Paenibacillus aurantiacus]|uniref:Response regulator transcription factor n=1 Tax=Paenibacillus aurantiacus TaxID=1936118 RepID=A0ABV5L0Z0_9BACL
MTFNTPSVLVVDDDADIRRMIGIYLRQADIDAVLAEDVEDALRRLAVQPVGLVLLDIMMPGVDGFELCRRIRELSKVPIMFVSAKTADWDKVHGLDVGADDYMTKPFSPAELVARVKAHLRRAAYSSEPPKEAAADSGLHAGIAVDPERRSVTVYGQPVRLTKTEFDILWLLVQHPNRVFPADEIYERVWGEHGPGSPNAVMVHISRLREKLGQMSGESEWIANVWGVGYKISDGLVSRH